MKGWNEDTVREYLVKHGAALAKQLGVHRNTLNNWSNRSCPSFVLGMRLSKMTGIPLEALHAFFSKGGRR